MPKGVSMLIVVLIIGAACLSLSVSALWLSEGEKELTFAWSNTAQAKQFAEGCLENALERLKIEPAYSGEFLSLGPKSCIITINKIGSPMTSATVEVLGTFNDYSQRLAADFEVVNDNFNLVAWQED